MMQLYMGYKEFSWPRLPDTLCMENEKYTQVLEQPENGETLQELGSHGRKITGSGVFLGEQAAQQWTTLCGCYAKEGAGILYLPGREPITAVFTKLTLSGSPRSDRIAYQFAFHETGKAQTAVRTYRVQQGDCLWSAAAAAGVSVESLLAANPGKIRWANELETGMGLVLP